MNYRMIGHILSRILTVEAALLLLPLLVTLLYGETAVMAFCLTIVLLLAAALPLGVKRPADATIYAREGFVIVALAWIIMSLFGALPFVLSGAIPNYIDAFFETVSGFTTTGSSILSEVESLEHGILFWRSFTHWVGGMGVLVFVMAVLPTSDGRTMHLMRAEVPGPTVGKLASKVRDTAKLLYTIYFFMTLIQVLVLWAFGMPLFDCFITAFGTAGTGGFSNRNISIGAYNNPVFEIIIGIFLVLFGINFNLYYFLLLKRFREVFTSEELLTYLGIIATSVILIAANIFRIYGSVSTSIRYAFFQVASIITTAGFTSVDFNLWPTLSKTVLVILMFVGACAGSTGGGLKIARIVILFKATLRDLKRLIHPHAIVTIRFEKKPLEERTVQTTSLYLVIYTMLFTLSVLLLSFEGVDLTTTFTAVAACFNNIGPGLELVGPLGNFSFFSPWGKLLLSADMLIGRLEIFPMLLLCSRSVWVSKRHKPL